MYSHNIITFFLAPYPQKYAPTRKSQDKHSQTRKNSYNYDYLPFWSFPLILICQMLEHSIITMFQ